MNSFYRGSERVEGGHVDARATGCAAALWLAALSPRARCRRPPGVRSPLYTYIHTEHSLPTLISILKEW